MKTKYLFFILLITSCFAVNTQPGNTFKISGKIKGVPDGGIVLLVKMDGRVGNIFVRDTIQNGIFTLEGEADSLEMTRLTIIGDKYPSKSIPMWIAPNVKTNITGKGHHISTWDIKSNIKEQMEEELYRDALKERGAESDSLFYLFYDNLYKLEVLTDENEKESLRKENQLIGKQRDNIAFIEHRRIFETMAAQPVSERWINRLSEFAGFAIGISIETTYPEENIKQMQALYNRLTNEQKQSQQGQLIQRYIFPMQLIKAGNKMASAELFDPQGNPHQIAEKYKGKYLLLDFWGVGCAPCIAAFPEMKEIYDEKKDRLTIISITTDTEKIWKEGLARYQLPWVNLTDNLGMEGYASLYGIRGIPFYVLISPDGVVQKMWSGYGKGSLKERLKDI